MSTPSIRGFQLDGSAIGDAAKSVNLYRGDVNLPLHLVSLDGPHGLNVSLSAYYSSNVDQQVSTWNRDAPTGIMGLGWSLPFDHIAFEGNGTASWLQGQFSLTTGGNSHPLTLLSYTGTEANQDESLCFADPLNPLWQFTYSPADESWQVQRDDGVTMVFGDKSSGRDTVQWGVRWDNWAGNSAAASGSPQRFGVVWNLSTLTDQWSNRVSYTYQPDQQPVTGALNYTRACYLQKILDGYGRSVIFSYKDKETAEYQPPHTVDGKTPTAGYQDRYETQYLAQIDVCPPGSDGTLVYYSLVPGYALHDLGGDASVPTTKRYLVSLAQQRGGQEVLPAMGFAYNLDSNTSGPGQLVQVTYPAGGQVNWTYTDVPLADPDDPTNIFNLSYRAGRPSGSSYASAIPRLWFGSDYVIVGWYGGENLLLNVYSYGGRWSAPWTYELSGVNPQTDKSNPDAADKLDQIQVAMGSDFFALHFHNSGNSSDRLYLFKKADYQFGQWSEKKETIDLSTSSVAVDETVLVAGNDFVALHVGGTSHLYRFRYNPVTKAWSADSPVSHNNSAKHIALAARENTLLACFFNGSSSVTGQSIIYYLKGDYTWGSYDPSNATSSFTWDSSYAQSYWQWGTGFVVGTCLSDSGSAHLQIIKWQRNFAGFSLSTKTVNNGSAYSQVAGSVIVNGGNFFRYDGQSWQEAQISWKSSDYLAVSDDTVLRARKEGSSYSDNVLATFDPVTDQWHTTTAFPTGDAPQAYAHAVGPQFGGDFLTLGDRVYYRDSGSDWQEVAHNSPLPHVYGGTVANLGPAFVTYQNADNRDGQGGSTDSYVALLKNGDILKVADPFGSRKVQTTDGNAILCGANAFATYDADISDFSHVGHFTLQRVLNHDIGPDQSACVVSGLSIDTGDQLLTTTYDYQDAARTAIFDESGTVVQYPQVTMAHVDGKGHSLGSTLYQYYNGLPPETADPAAADGPGLSLSECYSLAAGYIQTKTEYDDTGAVVATKTNVWQGVTLRPQRDGGFTPLSGIVVLCLQQSIDTSENLALIDPASDAITGSDGQRSFSISHTFVPETGGIRSKTTTLHGGLAGKQNNNADALQTRKAELTYAWEVYDGMKSPGSDRAPMLNTEAQLKLFLNDTLVQSAARTFSDKWSQAGAWSLAASWQWNGSGDGAFNFASPETNAGDWLSTASVASRNAAGNVEVARNNLGVPAVSFYDNSGLYKLGEVINSDGTDAAFSGFETYEPPSPWSGGKTITGDAHSGSACVQLAASKALSGAGLTSAAGQTRYLLSGFVKSVDGASVNLSLQVGKSAAATTTCTAAAEWQYVFVVADADAAGGKPLKSTVTNAGAGTLLVDDLWMSPLTAGTTAIVYNSLMMPTARVGRNGATSRTFYDAHLRPFAHAEPDEQMTTVGGVGYAANSRSALTGGYNTKLALTADDGGPFDDFRDGDGWQTRWASDDTSAWRISEQVLTHQGKHRHTLTLNATAAYANYAVHLQVSQGAAATPASGSFGVTIGDSLTAQWNATKLRWELLDGKGALLDQLPTADQHPPLLPCNLLVLATGHSAHVFVNQQLTLAYVAPSSQAAIQGSLGLFTDADGLGFAQVLVFLTPRAQLTFLDGCRRSIQGQQLADNAIIVGQSFYDERGRPGIHTKPARYEQTFWGYQDGFAAAPDPDQAWRMPACDLVSYYDGSNGNADDGGYPYTRSRLENSVLSRILETGQPGAAYAIGSGKSRTGTLTYATNTAGDLYGQSLPAQEYAVLLKTDPDGLKQIGVKDKIGNHYLTAGFDPSGGVSRVSSSLLDNLDHPTIITAPNGYAPPTGTTAADWQQTVTYTPLGRISAHAQADTGTTQFIYDDLGRVRFTLTADGAAQGVDPGINPCASGVAILYSKYDSLGRPVENGYTCQPKWDSDALQSQANDPAWPSAASSVPRFRFYYDGDGTTPNAHGRVHRIETVQSDGSIVTETYTYNLQGRLLSATTAVPDGQQGTLTYTYNHAGKLTATTIPSLGQAESLTVQRAYDARGLLSGIHAGGQTLGTYTWNATGQPQTEVLGDGLVTRNFTYTATGRLAAIAGSVSGKPAYKASLQLYYETGPASLDPKTNPWTPRYNGRLSAMQYQFGDGPAKTWTYDWDDQGRLTSAYGSDGETLGYAYDANGNVTKHDDTTFTFVPKTNQIQSVSSRPGNYAYTPSGRLATNPDWQFQYDFVSGLVTGMSSRDGSRTLSFLFGASPQRLVKNWSDGTGSTCRRYLNGANRHTLLEKTRGTDGTQAERKLLHGPAGLMAVQSEDNAFAYVVKDHEQSTRLVVAADGTETARFDYRPFGLPDDPPGGSDPDAYTYRYTGQEWDPETGLYNYRHRLYDPSTLRFISPDPMHQYFSPYLFVADSPLQHTDASGAWSFGATAGCLIGGAEIIGGAALIGAGIATSEFGVGVALGVAGGAVMGAGVGGLGYSINTGVHGGYKWSQFGNAELGGAIGGAEIAAGVTLMAISGGAGYRLGGSTLLGAGFNSLAYSAMAGNGFDWDEYGIQMGAGAAAGAVAGGCSLAGEALEVGELAEEGGLAQGGWTDASANFDEAETESTTSRVVRSAKKYAWDATGGTLGGVTGQVTNIGLTRATGGKASWSDLYSPRTLTEDAILFGMGFLSAGIGDAYASRLGVNDYDPVKWGSDSDWDVKIGYMSAFKEQPGTWWKFKMPSMASRPMVAQKFFHKSDKFWGKFATGGIPEQW